MVDILTELDEYGCQILVHDPLADPVDAKQEYGVELHSLDEMKDCQAVILAVPHAQYLALAPEDLGAMMSEDAILIDIKSVMDREGLAAQNLSVWRL